MRRDRERGGDEGETETEKEVMRDDCGPCNSIAADTLARERAISIHKES